MTLSYCLICDCRIAPSSACATGIDELELSPTISITEALWRKINAARYDGDGLASIEQSGDHGADRVVVL